MPETGGHALAATLTTILKRRLDGEGPLGVAVSGGGDSVALLYALARWGRRPLHVFCVDHGLNPLSGEWTRAVAQHAAAAGAAFTSLHWTGPKPASGLSAAARNARHGLLAEAARAAGVRVLCLAHTRDDLAEAQWMRARGSTVGAPAEWSPSPAWPQGRGVFLLRPLLGVSRAVLRQDLLSQGIEWIDDPANANPQSLRARARLADKPEAEIADAFALSPERMRDLLDDRWSRLGLISLRQNMFAELPQILAHRVLAAAMVCAGGGDRLPRSESVAAIVADLPVGKARTLCGARILAEGDYIHVAREAGDIGRHGDVETAVMPNLEAVWDGRFAIRAGEAGAIVPSGRVRDRLDDDDRGFLHTLPAILRGTLPVFGGKMLRCLGQGRQTDVHCQAWVRWRFAAACGVMQSEVQGEAQGDGQGKAKIGTALAGRTL